MSNTALTNKEFQNIINLDKHLQQNELNGPSPYAKNSNLYYEHHPSSEKFALFGDNLNNGKKMVENQTEEKTTNPKINPKNQNVPQKESIKNAYSTNNINTFI